VPKYWHSPSPTSTASSQCRWVVARTDNPTPWHSLGRREWPLSAQPRGRGRIGNQR
jgi:hypothetical protein